ncbi:BatD family protein [Pelagicoccus mobilis]|uniref:BatD family protein n=1 Tax=Pelagicoccus mobilis TaxID=415221 RepID=A0A934RXJ4_9BACT|nr:BatD family protein [Pelagicoccus mobilis]MBK1877305.1 BatD family protein [Pelagicoccus mobilis]
MNTRRHQTPRKSVPFGVPTPLRSTDCLRALIVFLLCFPVILRAQQTLEDLVAADRLRLTTSLTPSDEIYATQKVVLTIEIATDQWFAGGTEVGSLEVPNAVVLQRQTFAINSTRRSGGKTWAIQQWEIEIYPQREELYQIPSIEVGLTVSGDDGKPIRGSLITNTASFVATSPPGAPEDSTWIASKELTLRETWSDSMEELKVGEARERTITIEADGLPAMMLPRLSHPQTAGLSIYPKPGKIHDETSRGAARATRIENASYFFETPNIYTLPKIQIHWWNLEKETWEVASLPELTFEVSPNPDLPQQLPSETETKTLPLKRLLLTTLAIGLSTGILLLLLRFLKKPTRIINSLTRSVPINSEKHYWKQLTIALKKQDPAQIVPALYDWTTSIQPSRSTRTIRDISYTHGNSHLNSLTTDLLRASYSKEQPHFLASKKLHQELKKARHSIKAIHRSSSSRLPHSNDLSQLNPNRM